MLLKESTAGMRRRDRHQRHLATLRRLRPVAIIVGAVVLTPVLIAGAFKLAQLAPFYGPRALANWAGSIGTEAPSLNLHLKFEAIERLAYERDQALERGKIVQETGSFVPALVQLADRTVKAKVRLKGDRVNHVEGDKWSLRLQIKGNDSVFGMRSFSIQDPVQSAFVYEWVLHRLMRYAGLVSLRYDFVDVTINGKPMGIYALEESFGKELLESQQRREGPIVRFDEEYLWADGHSPVQSDIFLTAEVDAFHSKKVTQDPSLRKQFFAARELLEDFRDRRRTVGEAFDLERTATCFALVDLCSAYHALRWKNIRFYYNPVTSRLEPIPYNAYGAHSALVKIAPSMQLLGQREYDANHVARWLDAFFQDPEFVRHYVRALDRVSQRSFLVGFFTEVNEELHEEQRIIHRDNPAFVYSDDYLKRKANFIRNEVRPKIPLRVRFDPSSLANGSPRLSVRNHHRLKTELLAVVDQKTRARYAFDEPLLLARPAGGVSEPVSIALPASARDAFGEFDESRFVLAYHIFGMDPELTAPIHLDASEGPPDLDRRAAAQGPLLPEQSGFHVDVPQKKITIDPGTWEIRETLFLPAGYVVHAGPGVTLDLKSGASIISYASLQLRGSAREPVVVTSSDGSGGGLVVMGSKAESHLEHVRCERLGVPVEGLWQLTGAVTFYESPVRLVHCAVGDSRAEDQLNIIRSSFHVEDTQFVGAPSDALDVDFGTGAIEDCRFARSVNDAIDVSGTEVRIARCRAEQIGDKALSAGENSRVALQHFEAVGVRFGVVSKDLSSVTGSDVTIQRSEMAVAAYQKKPEYGPASVTLSNLRIEGADTATLIELGSWADLDGQRTRGTALEVARELYDE